MTSILVQKPILEGLADALEYCPTMTSLQFCSAIHRCRQAQTVDVAFKAPKHTYRHASAYDFSSVRAYAALQKQIGRHWDTGRFLLVLLSFNVYSHGKAPGQLSK